MKGRGRKAPGRLDIEELRARLRETEETLEAIRRGDVDAIVVEGPAGPQVYSVTNADQPYRAIVEQMQQGAVVLTPTGEIFYGNRRFAQMVGVPLERIVGLAMEEFVDVPDRPAFAGLLAQGTGTLEGVLLASGGTAVPVYLAANRFAGSEVSVCVVVTDLTEQKRQASREASLAREEAARVQAEAANRAKDEFLAMLSHELRGPLSVILNTVEMLDHQKLPEEQRPRLRGIIRRQGRHLARLVDDLLDATRVSQGRIELHREPVDLAGIVAAAVEDHRPLIEAAGHSLAQSLLPGPVPVVGDRTRLLQIIGNLLHNAGKYTPSGGRIGISLRRVGEVAEVRVRDTGVGIAPELLTRIFDLFVQGKPSLDRSGGGLGIGLTLVRRLVELHGGSVEARSDGEGRGSEFTVRLPLTDLTVDAAPTSSPTDAAPTLRILLIEDDAEAREMVAAGLQLLHQSVSEASDGEAGIRMVAADPPDAAVIDIGLPGMDGYETGQRLRAALGPRLVLVALTGYGLADDRRRVKEAGFDAHLVKPVVPQDILATILVHRAGGSGSTSPTRRQ